MRPYKIILFGSQAQDQAGKDSDLDIAVILDNYEISLSYEERLRQKVALRRMIRPINYRIPIDLFVYSRGEYRPLEEWNRIFFREIEDKGRVLYEKTG